MVDAEYFDQWYADIDASPKRRQIFAESLGLPPEIEPSNLVPLSGLGELAGLLELGEGSLLVDVACGRGGPGMWITRETGCRLVGVDFSAVAVEQATQRRERFGLTARAEFGVGDLTATGLADATADAVLCIDAVQFATVTADAVTEFRRVAKPGAPVVLTCWEPVEPSDEALPERMRSLDLAAALEAAGLVDVRRVERPQWRAIERQLWERAVATPADGDPAIESMHEEAQRVLPTFDRVHRVLVAGRAPAAAG